jgi:hypothetical protein
MCFTAKGRLQGRAVKLLRARRRSRYSEDLGQFALQLTARQLREFALPGVIHRLIVPVADQELVPVGRQVWRGICKVGCGWFCDRGI